MMIENKTEMTEVSYQLPKETICKCDACGSNIFTFNRDDLNQSEVYVNMNHVYEITVFTDEDNDQLTFHACSDKCVGMIMEKIFRNVNGTNCDIFIRKQNIKFEPDDTFIPKGYVLEDA